MNNRKTLKLASIIVLLSLLTGCSSSVEKTEQRTYNITKTEIIENFTKLSETYTENLTKVLQEQFDVAVVLIDESDGKVADNNVSRSALSAYMKTVEAVLKADIGENIEEVSVYRRKVLLSYDELSDRINAVQSEMAKWTNNRESVLKDSKKHKKSEKVDTRKVIDLEKMVTENSVKQKRIESERAERYKKAQDEITAKKKATADKKNKEEEQKKKEEERLRKELEDSVEVTIKNPDITTHDGIPVVTIAENMSLTVGTVVKVKSSDSRIYTVTFTKSVESLIDVNVSQYDIVFLYETESEVFVYAGELKGYH